MNIDPSDWQYIWPFAAVVALALAVCRIVEMTKYAYELQFVVAFAVVVAFVFSLLILVGLIL